jgi:hypothetical protein
MAKRQDELNPSHQGGERGGRPEDTPRGSGSEDIRGIASDEEDDEFEDDDDLDESEEDESEDL